MCDFGVIFSEVAALVFSLRGVPFELACGPFCKKDFLRQTPLLKADSTCSLSNKLMSL